MTPYNTLNVTLSSSQRLLILLILAIRNRKTELTFKLSSNLIESSNDETNFPHKSWLLTNTQVSKIPKAFAIGSSANIKFSKTQ